MSLAALEEFSPRHIQVLRGAMTSKMVASKSAIHSLQKVDISDLAENEKCKSSCSCMEPSYTDVTS